MVLTIKPDPVASISSQRSAVEARSKTVASTIRGIVQQLRRSSQLRAEEGQGPLAPETGKPTQPGGLTFWLVSHQKPLHPETPVVDVGQRQGATVVYVAGEKEDRLSQVSIVTVTEQDAKHAGT
jgi:hypothetical protein